VEVAALFGTDSRLRFAPKFGVSRWVDFHPDELALFRKGTLTHNHPEGSCLSDADLSLAAEFDLRAIRAVGKFGTFEAVRPIQGWPDAETVQISGELAFNLADAESYEEFLRDRRSAKVRSDEELDRRWMELTLKYMQQQMALIGVTLRRVWIETD